MAKNSVTYFMDGPYVKLQYIGIGYYLFHAVIWMISSDRNKKNKKIAKISICIFFLKADVYKNYVRPALCMVAF